MFIDISLVKKKKKVCEMKHGTESR